MTARRDQFKSSYGAFAARERELARTRAQRDARDARDAAEEQGGAPEAAPQPSGSVGRADTAAPPVESGRAGG